MARRRCSRRVHAQQHELHLSMGPLRRVHFQRRAYLALLGLTWPFASTSATQPSSVSLSACLCDSSYASTTALPVRAALDAAVAERPRPICRVPRWTSGRHCLLAGRSSRRHRRRMNNRCAWGTSRHTPTRFTNLHSCLPRLGRMGGGRLGVCGRGARRTASFSTARAVNESVGTTSYTCRRAPAAVMPCPRGRPCAQCVRAATRGRRPRCAGPCRHVRSRRCTH